MLFWSITKNEVVNDDNKPYVGIDGTTYTWPKSEIPELVEVLAVTPTPATNQVAFEWYAEQIAGTWTQVWNYRDKTAEEIAAEEAMIIASKRAKYQNESDPLFFKWQADEEGCTQQIWQSKRNEIKNS